MISVSAILLDSIAIAAFLIYLPFLAVVYARSQVGYDLATPRAMFDKLPDYAKRATWAHQNSFETFMVYSAAALTAYVTNQDSMLVAGAAITFVVARFFFSMFYIFNVPLGRSFMFGIGTTCTGILFVMSLLTVHLK